MSEPHKIHMPSPSIWPLLMALSFLLISYTVIGGLGFLLAGVVLLLVSIGGWVLENRGETKHHD